MDVNYYLLREQVERARAEAAACECSRSAHRQLADRYRICLDEHRRAATKH